MDYEASLQKQLEIARARVSEIEGHLESYRSWRRLSSGAPTASGQGLNGAGDASAKRVSAGEAPNARSSKNQPIFDAFEAAGAQGLSQKDVLRVASEHGLLTNPDALRALCWSAKKDGRLISLAPGRYAIAQRNEAAAKSSAKGETAASADHNRHRTGDAGGGI